MGVSVVLVVFRKFVEPNFNFTFEKNFKCEFEFKKKIFFFNLKLCVSGQFGLMLHFCFMG